MVPSELTGDIDAFMKAKGIGYVSRSLAKSTGYGVNKMHQSVEQDGDKLKITTTNPKGTKVLNLLANGEEQEPQGQTGTGTGIHRSMVPYPSLRFSDIQLPPDIQLS